MKSNQLRQGVYARSASHGWEVLVDQWPAVKTSGAATATPKISSTSIASIGESPMSSLQSVLVLLGGIACIAVGLELSSWLTRKARQDPRVKTLWAYNESDHPCDPPQPYVKAVLLPWPLEIVKYASALLAIGGWVLVIVAIATFVS